MVSWVAAFGFAGPLLPRLPLPPRITALVAPGRYLILAAAHLGISAGLRSGHLAESLLIALLGCGGLGLGAGFSPLIAHLTSAVPPRFAPDMSGLITTTAQLSGVVGVATFGTAYLALAPHPGPHPAVHAFTVITAGFGISALLATAAAYQSTHRPPTTADERAHADAAGRHTQTLTVDKS